jgi:hypothetical protein
MSLRPWKLQEGLRAPAGIFRAARKIGPGAFIPEFAGLKDAADRRSKATPDGFRTVPGLPASYRSRSRKDDDVMNDTRSTETPVLLVPEAQGAHANTADATTPYRTPEVFVVGRAVDLVQGYSSGKYSEGYTGYYWER